MSDATCRQKGYRRGWFLHFVELRRRPRGGMVFGPQQWMPIMLIRPLTRARCRHRPAKRKGAALAAAQVNRGDMRMKANKGAWMRMAF